MLAEIIERKEQLYALLNCGCDLGQGHLFAAPVTMGKAQQMLQNGRWSI